MVSKQPPLSEEGGGLRLRAVVAYEHVSMVTEGILRCSRIPGLAGRHEYFANGKRLPDGLSASERAAEGAVRALNRQAERGTTRSRSPTFTSSWRIA